MLIYIELPVMVQNSFVWSAKCDNFPVLSETLTKSNYTPLAVCFLSIGFLIKLGDELGESLVVLCRIFGVGTWTRTFHETIHEKQSILM